MPFPPHCAALYNQIATMGNNLAKSKSKRETLRALSRRVSRNTASHLRSDATVREAYKIGRTLGTGGFSVVKLATERESGDIWACKIMTLPAPGKNTGDGESTREDILKEIEILMSLSHPNIIFLKEYFEEPGRVYVIMEYLGGGELLDALLNKEKGADGLDAHYSESDARLIFKQLISGVKYLHDIGIVHRDLKLENLLLATKGDVKTIKIADFGLAKKYGHSQLSTICGTPQYVAPEVIRGGSTPYTYGTECDLWSCGIILFILLAGYPPFYDDSEPRLFRKIRAGKYNMQDPVWDLISDEAKDLIAKLLEVEPEKRLNVNQVLEHAWMKEEEKKNLKNLGTISRMRTSMKMKGMPSPEVLGLSPEEMEEIDVKNAAVAGAVKA
jgi:serine/threonine protein kinase